MRDTVTKGATAMDRVQMEEQLVRENTSTMLATIGKITFLAPGLEMGRETTGRGLRRSGTRVMTATPVRRAEEEMLAIDMVKAGISPRRRVKATGAISRTVAVVVGVAAMATITVSVSEVVEAMLDGESIRITEVVAVVVGMDEVGRERTIAAEVEAEEVGRVEGVVVGGAVGLQDTRVWTIMARARRRVVDMMALAIMVGEVPGVEGKKS